MRSSSKWAFFGDAVFEVCDEVYEPSEDTFLFADNLHVRAGSRVLDMGTGSGILGTTAAKEASEVLAVDVNPHAIRCAKKNAKRNRLDQKMAFLQADLFAGLQETSKFDLVLFNSPYLPSERGEEATWIGRSWAGGVAGREVIDRFISQVPEHLERGGQVLLLQSTLAGCEETKEKFLTEGLVAEVVASQALPFFETLILVSAKFVC